MDQLIFDGDLTEHLNSKLVEIIMEDQDLNLDYSRISSLLQKSGLNSDEANELTERISNMASANLIAQFRSELKTSNTRLESKIDAQNSKIDAQNSKYNLLIGLVTGGVTAIIALSIAIIGWLLAN